MPGTHIALPDEGIDQARREISQLLEQANHCRQMASQLQVHRDSVGMPYGRQMSELTTAHIEDLLELSTHYDDLAVMLARTLEQFEVFDHALAERFAQMGQ